MVVNVPLDYTPQSTMSTIQFRSETLNIILASVLTVLILANIGSILSKLVNFTEQTRFKYHSWIRAFIFANSDDPIRITTWLFRGYAYRDRNWARAKTRLRLDRLVVPLLARFFVLLASIASVAVTLPGEKEYDGCKHADYRLRWDPTQARFSDTAVSPCIDIPLESNLGSVRASAAYCQCPNYSLFGLNGHPLDPGEAWVAVSRSPKDAKIFLILAYGDDSFGTTITIDLKNSGERGVTYRTNVNSLDVGTQMDISLTAVKRAYPNCTETRRTTHVEDAGEAIIVYLDRCFLDDPRNMRDILESHFRNALVWEKVTKREFRIKIDQLNGEVEHEFTYDCPIRVVITRPLVNIVPLALILIVWFAVNVLVSYIVSKHSNVPDAAFHIIQEMFGHDSQANPLEENEEQDEIMQLDLYKWNCTSSGGGHVGFIGRSGDYAVDEFEQNRVIGGCPQARTEFAAMRARVRGPNASSVAGESSWSAMDSNESKCSAVLTNPVQSSLSTSTSGPSGAIRDTPTKPIPAYVPPAANGYIPVSQPGGSVNIDR